MRKIKLETDEYYHICNRGVDKRKIFMDKWDYIRFLKSIREFNSVNQIESLRRVLQLRRGPAPKPLSNQRFDRGLGASQDNDLLVNVICYNLLPNHYHLLIKQLVEGGISKFMQKISQGFTSYFNFKNDRSGSLFQGTYQAVKIETNEQLLFTSAYINGNAGIHGIDKANVWQWSSCLDYLGKRNGTLCDKRPIMKQFENVNEYFEYLKAVINGCKERKSDLEKFMIE